MKNYVVAITGASGTIYGLRLIEELIKTSSTVTVLISKAAELVLKEENGLQLDGDEQTRTTFLQNHFNSKNISYYDRDNLLAPIASGSYPLEAMIVMPCSMATVGSLAAGISSNLIERTADVALKENRPLIIVPRETPFNQIHIKNLLTLSSAGTLVAPAMPAFYNKPKTIEDIVDFVVGKVLDLLKIEHNLFKRWNGK
ncbi:MAG: UbiX family flavin prenyltransferase [Actinobacteria bacterium]|nr:MAG: UbiX family flavin prenyltransferase [Actinomycetota bacterium]